MLQFLGCDHGADAAVMLGVIGGVFLGIFPCLYMCFRAQKQWTKEFFDKSNPTVRRTSAVVREREVYTSQNQHGNRQTNTHVVVEFKPTRPDGSLVLVRASVSVSDSFFSHLYKGKEVEVAYRVGNERECALTGDQEDEERNTALRGVMCFVAPAACIFGSLGVLLAFLSVAHCYLGPVAFVLTVIGGALAGKYVWFPILKCFRHSCIYVSASTESDDSGEDGSQDSGRTAESDTQDGIAVAIERNHKKAEARQASSTESGHRAGDHEEP
jgi:hypothetical protein